MTTTQFLDRLDAARAAGTPGPWHVDRSGGIDAGDYDTVIGRGDVDCMAHCYGGTSTIEGDNLAADAALIVAAVNALPKLTAAVRAVLALCESAERDVSELLGLRAGLRIASNVSSDDIRAVLADALAGDS